eukprot:scaffold94310_cov18-Tisochrysis_lutea.AAC.2
MTCEGAREYLRALARAPLAVSCVTDTPAHASPPYSMQGWCSLGDGDDLLGLLSNPLPPAWGSHGAVLGPHWQQHKRQRLGRSPQGPARGLSFGDSAPLWRDVPLETVEEQVGVDGDGRAQHSTQPLQQQQQQRL